MEFGNANLLPMYKNPSKRQNVVIKRFKVFVVETSIFFRYIGTYARLYGEEAQEAMPK